MVIFTDRETQYSYKLYIVTFQSITTIRCAPQLQIYLNEIKNLLKAYISQKFLNFEIFFPAAGELKF